MQLNTFLCLLVIGTQAVLIRAAPRIFNGTDASPTQFPYHVSVEIDGWHHCGGAIISKNYILTAQHCLPGGPNEHDKQLKHVTIRAGTIFRSRNGTVAQISDYVRHDKYDIALIRLAEPLKFTEFIQSIPIATKLPEKGAFVTILGFGRTEPGRDGNVLKYIDDMNVDLNYNIKVLVLRHPEGKGCHVGDSGGPAVYKNELVGICVSMTTYKGADGNTITGIKTSSYLMLPLILEWIYQNSDLKSESQKP